MIKTTAMKKWISEIHNLVFIVGIAIYQSHYKLNMVGEGNSRYKRQFTKQNHQDCNLRNKSWCCTGWNTLDPFQSILMITTQQVPNEFLCNCANGNEILQKFQNDITLTLIINNMNEYESIKILRSFKLNSKRFMTGWHRVLHYNNIAWHIIESTIYNNHPFYCWGSYNFLCKTDAFVDIFLETKNSGQKKWFRRSSGHRVNFSLTY